MTALRENEGMLHNHLHVREMSDVLVSALSNYMWKTGVYEGQ